MHDASAQQVHEHANRLSSTSRHRDHPDLVLLAMRLRGLGQGVLDVMKVIVEPKVPDAHLDEPPTSRLSHHLVEELLIRSECPGQVVKEDRRGLHGHHYCPSG